MNSPDILDHNATEKQIDYTARLEVVHVLVIVSSPTMGTLIKRIFRELGFRKIFIAIDTGEAITIMRREKIDLIVADNDIKTSQALAETDNPGSGSKAVVTGLDFVSRLRHARSSPNPFTPVIMLVDEVDPKTALQSRDMGINEILLKPLNAKELCHRIISAIDNPRDFITSPTYRGPCRRRKEGESPTGEERRITEIRLIRHDEAPKRKA